jgi:hypothetical protein
MTQFHLHDQVIARLAQAIRDSDCGDPVVTLNEVVLPDNASCEFTRSYQARLDQRQLDGIAEKDYLENSENWLYILDVSVFEREVCEQERANLIEISGFTFAMAKYIFETLRECQLIVEGDRFLLKDADEVFPNLRSALLKHYKEAEGADE